MAQRKKIILGSVVFLGMLALFFALPSFAQDRMTTTGFGLSDDVVRILTNILQLFTRFLGWVLTMLVQAVIWIAQYTDFVNARPVVTGWVIVRDVANMFFIVVLLLIAFGTILGQEEYHYKKLLPKLLILAVLVNFSRTIMGVFIDFGQVVMLTFVNGFKAAAGGNFANLFKIADLLKKAEGGLFSPALCPKIGAWEVFGAYALAFAMVLISVVTIFVIFAVLALRIIMLWLLTILSPVAFLAGTFPQGQKYYAQWWEEFRNQVMAGPMLAFFIWLALITVGGGESAGTLFPEGQPAEETMIQTACTAVGSTDSFISYIIGIFMLLAGVQMSQQMGGAISGIAGRAKGIGEKFAKMGAGMLLGPALWGMKWGAARADDAQAHFFQKRFLGDFLGGKVTNLANRMKDKKGFIPDMAREYSARLGKLAVHGVQMRTLPAAWKLRGERVEKERLQQSMSVAYDLLNRGIPIGRAKSDFTEIALGQAAHTKAEELKAGGTEQEIIRQRILNDFLDPKTGQVELGKESDLEGALMVLAEQHDINEFMKDPKVSKFVRKAMAAQEGRTISDEEASVPLEVGAESLVRYITHVFGGPNQNALRVLNRIGHAGFENSDDWAYKISERDPETGQYYLAYNPFELDKMKKEGRSDEDIQIRRKEMEKAQGEAAAAYAAKRTARINMTNLRGQSFFTERAGWELNKNTGQMEQVRFFEGLNENGKAVLRQIIPKSTGHFRYMQPEAGNALGANVDSIFEYLEEDFDKLNLDQQKGIASFVGFLLTGDEKKQGEEGGKIYNALKNRKKDDSAKQLVANFRRQAKQHSDGNRDHENIAKVKQARSKGEQTTTVVSPADKIVSERIVNEAVREKGQQAFAPGHQKFKEVIPADPKELRDLPDLNPANITQLPAKFAIPKAELTDALTELAKVLRQKVQELDRVGKTGTIDRETGQEMSHAQAFEGSRIGQALQTVFNEQTGALRTPPKRDEQYDNPPAAGEEEKEKVIRESNKEESYVRYEEGIKTFLRSLHTLASEAATPQTVVENAHEVSAAAKVDFGELVEALDRIESALKPGDRATATTQFENKAETTISALMPKVDRIPAKANAVRDLGALKRELEQLKQGTAHLKILSRDDLNRLRKFLKHAEGSV